MPWIHKVKIKYIGLVFDIPHWIVSEGGFYKSFTDLPTAICFACQVYQDKLEEGRIKEWLDRW